MQTAAVLASSLVADGPGPALGEPAVLSLYSTVGEEWPNRRVIPDGRDHSLSQVPGEPWPWLYS